MHINRQSAAVHKVRLVVELRKKLSVEHTDNKVEAGIVFVNQSKYSALISAAAAGLRAVWNFVLGILPEGKSE